MDCISVTVRIRGNLGNLHPDRAPRLRLVLGHVVGNGFQPPRRPDSCQVVSSSPTSTPWRPLMGIERRQRRQLPVDGDAATCGSTEGSTATRPSRPVGGSRSQATYS